jgi:hypothetical protein
MRRLSLSWVLSLLLLVAQHGAVLHELGHLSHADHGTGATVRLDLQSADAGGCQTCEAFAQIANPAGCGASVPAACPAALLPLPVPRFTIIAADAPTARSRGPPPV